MAVEKTLLIIKPDAVAKNVIGEILARFEQDGLRIIAAKMVHLSIKQAKALYAEHKHRPFYKSLVEFMTSGPVMVQVLGGDDAVAKSRRLMGATIPGEAKKGTIRHDFGNHEPVVYEKNVVVYENAVHGSDSTDSADRERRFFFEPDEICPRTR